MEILNIKNLTFSYPDSEDYALDNVSLDIQKGEFAVLCGKSGCGKTTLLKLIKKELAPKGKISGEIRCSGKSVSEMTQKESASEIGYVMQNPENQTVTDKVWHELAFGLESLGVPSDEIRRRVGEMASFFGINSWFHSKTSELSGGQKQLLNLASVMVMNPKILILDEPTSQLDPIGAAEFIATLKKINSELGVTILIAEHRLEEVFTIADKVIFMSEGKILCCSEPDKVWDTLSETEEGKTMRAALPSAVRIFGGLDGVGRCPLTVREGADFLSNTYKNDVKSLDIKECKEERPIVWMEEIPWNEINIDNQLTLRCEDPFARRMEEYFRRSLFRWKYFQADHILEPVFNIPKTYYVSDIGLSIKENIVKTDDENNIVSHDFIDVLKNEEDIEKLHAPVITVDKEADERNMEDATDALNGVLPVRLHGIDNIYHAPWDEIPRLHGADNVLMDVALRPEFMHAVIKKFTEIKTEEINTYEKLGLLDGYCANLHCTPGFTDTLPGDALNEGGGTTKTMWFRHMAQIFGSVSPDMYNEFDIEYTKELMSRFGLVYWGCCEPLDNVIPFLKKIPNMRKIGVSPWANVEKCAEQIGSDYVLARKPNPAAVSLKTDCEAVKNEITETVNACRKNRCAFDYVLKDISSCGYKLENLVNWCDTVMHTLDELY